MKVILSTGASPQTGRACAPHLRHKGYRGYGTSWLAIAPGEEATTADDGGFRLLRMGVTVEGPIGCALPKYPRDLAIIRATENY